LLARSSAAMWGSLAAAARTSRAIGDTAEETSLTCRARIHECGYDLLLSEIAHGRSGSDLILMREAAEDLLSADRVLSEVDLRWPGVRLSRWQLAPGCGAAGMCCRGAGIRP